MKYILCSNPNSSAGVQFLAKQFNTFPYRTVVHIAQKLPDGNWMPFDDSYKTNNFRAKEISSYKAASICVEAGLF